MGLRGSRSVEDLSGAHQPRRQPAYVPEEEGKQWGAGVAGDGAGAGGAGHLVPRDVDASRTPPLQITQPARIRAAEARIRAAKERAAADRAAEDRAARTRAAGAEHLVPRAEHRDVGVSRAPPLPIRTP